MRRGRELVLAALFAVAPLARADDAPNVDPASRAREIFAEAKAAFARGDFAAAAAAFEQAAKLAPHPATWLNAAEAWEKRDEWVRAAEDCDQAFAAAGGLDEFRREAEARLARVLARVGTLDATGPRTASMRVDAGEPRALPARVRVVPGAHRIVFTELSTGREQAVSVSVRAGAVVAVAPEPFARPAPPPAAATASSSPPLGTWICFGLAGAFAVPATVFGVATLNAKSDYDSRPTRDKLDRFDFDRAATDISLVAAAISLAVGVGIWIAAPRRAPGEAVASPRRVEF